MKPSEKELKQRLWEKTHPKSKTIPVSINGTIVNAQEAELITKDYIDSCIKSKIDMAPENVTPLNIVEDVLAYKKAQLQRHKENRQCKGNVCICTDEDECTDERHEEMIEDAHSNKDNDFKTPYEKMSHSEQEELKDLLEKSKKITKDLNAHKNLDNIPSFNMFGTVDKPLLPNEKLVKEWKEYTERVNMFMAKHPKLPKYIVKAFMLDEYPGDENKQDEQCLGGVKWDVAEFEKITTQMFETYKKKNADYGSSFDDLFDEFGMTSALIRMKDKYNRLKSITEKKDIQVKDESVEDTLLDLANYCILTVLKLRKDRDFKHASKFKK